jgi:hypothetical protein
MPLHRLKVLALALFAAFSLLPAFGPTTEAAQRSSLPIESVAYILGGVVCEETDEAPSRDLPDVPVVDTCEANWSGSGVIIESTGVVLTNAHLVLDDDGEATWSVIGITEDDDELPSQIAFAWPILIDEELDLAMLLPIYTLDGDEIDVDELDLEPIDLPRDNESGLDEGDEVTVIGWPGLSEEDTISVEDAEIEEIVEDEENPDLDELGWYDVGSFEGPGISGGAVVNEDGELVGIATGGYGFIENSRGTDELVRPVEALTLFIERTSEDEDEGSSRDDEEAEEEDDDRSSRDDEDEDEDEGSSRDDDERESEDEDEDEGTSGTRSGNNGGDERETETEEQSEYVFVSGTLAEAATGNPIEGGLVVLLQPGLTLADFDPEDDSQIYSLGVSDADGAFLLAVPVERDQEYSVIIVAEGYAPIAADGIVFATGADPATVDIGVVEMEFA